jgi:arylformamidase
MKIIDISIPITPTMPIWPGDELVELTQTSAIAKGDAANISRIAMGVHTGTHIDAPKHFIESGITVDQISLDKLVGKALVLNIDHQVNVISEEILKAHPDIHFLTKEKKVLFKTRNSALWKQHPNEFYQNYVALDTSGANFLQQFQLDLIGIDYLSISTYEVTELPHQILLSAGIILLEGLDLSDVDGRFYQLYCLPLKLSGCEGAPARVILVEIHK